MTWWAWVVVGAILLGSELGLVDAQFYLVFVGAASLVVGVLSAAVPDLPQWLQWVAFGLLSAVLLIGFRSRVYGQLRGRPREMHIGPVGSTLSVPAELGPGASCQVEHGGVFWTVRNEGDAPIVAGGRGRVVRVHGLTLVVHPES
jgi:membrane protein implicated in regulation of membrane protease activity